MKKIEIKAFGIDQAKEIAKTNGITILKNITTSYVRNKPADIEVFAQDCLKKYKLDNNPNAGCIIVKQSGKEDSRKNPYKFVNCISSTRTTKKMIFLVKIKHTNVVVGEAPTKIKAIYLAKKLIKVHKKDLICVRSYKVIDNEDAFELRYKPSINTKQGEYLILGN